MPPISTHMPKNDHTMNETSRFLFKCTLLSFLKTNFEYEPSRTISKFLITIALWHHLAQEFFRKNTSLILGNKQYEFE